MIYLLKMAGLFTALSVFAYLTGAPGYGLVIGSVAVCCIFMAMSIHFGW